MNKNNIDKLKEMIDNEKNEKGLLAFHFSIGLASGINVEEIAGEIVEMHKSYLNGEYEDITNKVL